MKSFISAIIFIFFGIVPRASALKIYGTFNFGGLASTERFSSSATTTASNDVQLLSARSYFKLTDWGEGKWELVSDLRDKHDFFDKLNSERLGLVSRNEFQIRQLSIRKPNPDQFWAGQVGRFPVLEAGSVWVDGVQVENHWTSQTKSSLFSGLNPKKDYLSYLEFDPKAQIYGLNITHQNLAGGWGKNLYLSSALAVQNYDGHVDRQFWFNNFVFQWHPESRLIFLMYLDFVPRTYVQNGNIIWQQGWSQYFSTDLTGFAIDAIEYSRRKGVLEKIDPSPYREVSVQLNYRRQGASRSYLKYSNGRRDVDGLSKQEVSIGVLESQIFSMRWDAFFILGRRNNFQSDDNFVRSGLGYFSRKWESNLDLEYGIQVNKDGTSTRPFVAELSLAHYFSRQAYLVASYLRGADERVVINSWFVKFGYRFGSQEVPPVRDGAPPRGSI